jgi:hypothetical protein
VPALVGHRTASEAVTARRTAGRDEYILPRGAVGWTDQGAGSILSTSGGAAAVWVQRKVTLATAKSPSHRRSLTLADAIVGSLRLRSPTSHPQT